MPVSVTAAEAAKLSQDNLVRGVIANVIDVNPSFNFLRFTGIEGTGHSFNRENALGDVMVAGVGSEITANNPATFTKVTVPLTTIIGKASVNGLLQSSQSNFTDQLGEQILSKAKNVGRTFQQLMITGDKDVANEFDGLLNLVSNSQTVTATGADGDVLTLEKLDELLALVTAKDGQVDFLMMNIREMNAVKKLYRSLGGADMEMVTLSNGNRMLGYNGVPIFRNDFIPKTQVVGSASNAAPIIAGCFDDGGRNGIGGITSMNDFGIVITNPQQSENYDELYSHIKWYTSLVNYSDKGLAVATGIVPASA
jgi:hypothetical protein